MQVGEFVEVFNNSEDDPAAWLAKISEVLKGKSEGQYNVCLLYTSDAADE